MGSGTCPGKDAQGKAIGATKEGLETPMVVWTPAIAPGAAEFYTGDRFPQWKNNLFVAGLIGLQLRRLEITGDRVTREEVVFKDHGRVRNVVTGPDGLLYVALNSPGRIVRLAPVLGAAQAK
jgi:glucose/arabinose dehydrogenase